ncbi:hypothetical protein T265_00241 [Opisthorchis viverrini]|uniref:Reverse transcriptase domain-containing protein n=1 Tax=Opisthorchis viverrini TaxID=6198 RepID=A0A075A2X7_OPIVI|nr:hypothetical protein T265_00241 [Opisthorchis viverrini]KER34063.1 hypothetical protein T265_00241 [Opisthorchis viverrini]
MPVASGASRTRQKIPESYSRLHQHILRVGALRSPFKDPERRHPPHRRSFLSGVFVSPLTKAAFPCFQGRDCHANLQTGGRLSPGSYRPTSLTRVPCKTMEPILKRAVLDHLTSSSLISPDQHGFLSNRSCVTNMLVFMDSLTQAKDKGLILDAIFWTSQIPYYPTKLERGFTDRKVRGSNPTSASRLPLSRPGQPGSNLAAVLSCSGVAVRHRKDATAERSSRTAICACGVGLGLSGELECCVSSEGTTFIGSCSALIKDVRQSAWTQHIVAPTRYRPGQLPYLYSIITNERHLDQRPLLTFDFICYWARDPEPRTHNWISLSGRPKWDHCPECSRGWHDVSLKKSERCRMIHKLPKRIRHLLEKWFRLFLKKS